MTEYKEIFENLEEQLLKIERLLYLVNNSNYTSKKYNEEYKKYNQEFISIRGNYIELFKEFEDDFDQDKLTVLSTEKFCKDFIKNKDKKSIQELFDLIYKLIDICINILKLNELKKEKEEIIKSLTFILKKEEINIHKEILDKLFEEENIEKTISYLKELQTIILKDFKNKITNIDDFKNGDDFKFLCHSINFTNFNQKKQERYVSTSLITPSLTKTYRLGYGFIMPKDNIVCASSKDANADITAQTKDQITQTIIPRIDSIDKIEKECNNYSEVIIDGFNPIGIFCLTDGSKSLNLNYLRAHELQKSFPHLKIIDIDLTLYKENLTEERNNLINHINAYLGYFEEVDYDYYNIFFEKYLEMKKTNSYDKQDIIELFLKNTNKNVKQKSI